MADVMVCIAREDIDGEPVRVLLRVCGLSTAGLFSPNSVYVVARHAEAVVGICGLEMDGPSALVRSLAVDASMRGTGLSRRLIHDLVDLARDRGVERLFTFSKDTGNYFIHTGWHDVFLADAVPHIEATMQVQHYHAVGWYADERALRIDL